MFSAVMEVGQFFIWPIAGVVRKMANRFSTSALTKVVVVIWFNRRTTGSAVVAGATRATFFNTSLPGKPWLPRLICWLPNRCSASSL
jgi:hypothetical protein